MAGRLLQTGEFWVNQGSDAEPEWEAWETRAQGQAPCDRGFFQWPQRQALTCSQVIPTAYFLLCHPPPPQPSIMVRKRGNLGRMILPTPQDVHILFSRTHDVRLHRKGKLRVQVGLKLLIKRP